MPGDVRALCSSSSLALNTCCLCLRTFSDVATSNAKRRRDAMPVADTSMCEVEEVVFSYDNNQV